jgi:hypothetical protein
VIAALVILELIVTTSVDPHHQLFNPTGVQDPSILYPLQTQTGQNISCNLPGQHRVSCSAGLGSSHHRHSHSVGRLRVLPLRATAAQGVNEDIAVLAVADALSGRYVSDDSGVRFCARLDGGAHRHVRHQRILHRLRSRATLVRCSAKKVAGRLRPNALAMAKYSGGGFAGSVRIWVALRLDCWLAFIAPRISVAGERDQRGLPELSLGPRLDLVCWHGLSGAVSVPPAARDRFVPVVRALVYLTIHALLCWAPS